MALPTNSKKYISGITLIEMLIGVVISTIIMGAMYTTYTVVNQSYSQVTNKAKISRSGREYVEMLSSDIKFLKKFNLLNFLFMYHIQYKFLILLLCNESFLILYFIKFSGKQ